jgi:two-component system OmpR family response regulator
VETKTEDKGIAHVLLAEDDEDGREVLSTALRGLGAEVQAVADGGRLLVAIGSYYREGNPPAAPDLIVADVLMPVCSGLSVFEALRAAHWTTPVILISAKDEPAVRASAARYGATFMPKPLNLDALLQTAERLIASSRLREVDGVVVEGSDLRSPRAPHRIRS